MTGNGSPLGAALRILTFVALLLGTGSALAADPVRIAICSPHSRVLAHWLVAARDGRLPRTGISVVHFDAHPDLALPRAPIRPGWPAAPSDLMARVDIASFQLAAVRAGLVDEIVWLRPSWANQLPDGSREMRIGALSDGSLRVDDPADYYVLDGTWAPTSALIEPQPLRLRVLTLEQALAGPPLTEGPTILDIDLDGFATRNPAADRLRRAGLEDADIERVRAIFAPEGLALSADPAQRTAEVQELEQAIAALADGQWSSLLGSLGVLWRRGIGFGDLWALYDMFERADASAVDVLLEDGRTVVGVPERAADPAEVAETVSQLQRLLAHGIVRPQLVTIARSVEDGFTPAETWPAIEWRLLAALNEVLPEATVGLDPGLQPAPRPGAAPAAAVHPNRTTPSPAAEP